MKEVCKRKLFICFCTEFLWFSLLGTPTRNEKFLACVASGKWILHKSYLEDCRKAKRFVRVSKFVLIWIFVASEVFAFGGGGDSMAKNANPFFSSFVFFHNSRNKNNRNLKCLSILFKKLRQWEWGEGSLQCSSPLQVPCDRLYWVIWYQ